MVHNSTDSELGKILGHCQLPVHGDAITCFPGSRAQEEAARRKKAPVSNIMRLRDSMWNATQKTSSGQGSMMAQSSGPFSTVFMSAVSPPWRSMLGTFDNLNPLILSVPP
jgi:hypothetical protein